MLRWNQAPASSARAIAAGGGMLARDVISNFVQYVSSHSAQDQRVLFFGTNVCARIELDNFHIKRLDKCDLI